MDDETRWLDDEERQAWLGTLAMLMRLLPALDAQLQRDSGLGNFEYQVLAGLSESPGRMMRISELAKLSEGSLARVSQVLSRLERRGWIDRTPDPEDGRYTLAILTDRGFETVVAAAPGHVEAVRRYVIDPLTRAQLKQLATISSRVLHAIDPDSDWLARP
ncbi:MarR family winged helix-turn-helix transcriptional regulator [Actinoplanes solisilvae]|uniref:MarR family winged helix-turn-helix transcriptional regulator n=1 Tax=Actinoplanes solisilvae TaxID=2486853 RepID=UPI001F0C7F37|nr:MarR family transcriptional regulator [Actinoplanes solisilvae]